MEHKICVRIKSGEYVEALDLSRARRAVLHLTTIEDFQTAAEIPLYLVSGTERKPLATLSAERLSPLSSEECRLDLQTSLVGRRRAEFRVVQNGRLVLTETCGLPIPGPGRRILAVAAILAAAAGLTLLVLFSIRGCAADGGPGGIGARVEAPSAPAVKPRAPSAPASPASTEVAAPAAQGTAPEAAAVSAAPQTSPPPTPAPVQAPVRTDPLEAAREAFTALGEETLTVYFSADSAGILRDQRDKLGKVAAVLVRYPDLGITISGHCATAGTEKGRLALSQDRARAVYEALAAAGWKPKTATAVEGFGDERPATRAEDRQALNRRVEIRLAP
ncbi:MAG TPA: OmpA family protein [Spirochaetia bacterium]|nr:OmpA family protein [Spirochaetales bacterium]HRY81752.1 OmpA family protein [Spirochaetia bacterium]HRZ90074.1 OmpA family protein [Spirochaetia bacterium]